MNFVRNTLSFLLVVANTIVGFGYLLCAFSPYLSPTEHSVLSLAGLCIPIFIVANFCFLIFWLIVNWRFALVPLLFFLIGWNALNIYMPFNFSKEEGGKTLKVLTYNVQGMMPGKDESGKTTNPTLEYIVNSGADIVCVQEFPTENKENLRKLKAVYPYIRSTNTFWSLGVACLSKKPIISADKIEMSSHGNGSTVFRIKDGEEIIPVIVNHLESNKLDDHDKDIYKDMLKAPKKNKVESGSKHLIHKLADAVAIRGPQADVVAQTIREINSDKILVCGDFNDSPISYAHRVVAEGLQDAFVEAGNGPGITYNRTFLFFRIDHMLVGKAYRVIKCEVDRSIKASDHYPMWCLLEK